MMKENLCDKCTGLCCRYFSLPIETPEDEQDYEDIKWYLFHEGITVFVEDGDWYISIKSKCKYLTDDYRCTIYDKRPKICRTYTTKVCDFIEGEYDYELYFTDDKQMEKYIRKKFNNGMDPIAGLKRKKRKK